MSTPAVIADNCAMVCKWPVQAAKDHKVGFGGILDVHTPLRGLVRRHRELSARRTVTCQAFAVGYRSILLAFAKAKPDPIQAGILPSR